MDVDDTQAFMLLVLSGWEFTTRSLGLNSSVESQEKWKVLALGSLLYLLTQSTPVQKLWDCLSIWSIWLPHIPDNLLISADSMLFSGFRFSFVFKLNVTFILMKQVENKNYWSVVLKIICKNQTNVCIKWWQCAFNYILFLRNFFKSFLFF